MKPTVIYGSSKNRLQLKIILKKEHRNKKRMWDNWGWKGPQEIISSKLLLKQGQLMGRSSCSGLHLTGLKPPRKEVAQLLLGNLFQWLTVLIRKKLFLKSSQRYKDCNRDKRTINFQNKIYLIYTTSQIENWVSAFASQFNELVRYCNTSVQKREKVERNPKLLEIHIIKVSLFQ